MHGVGGHGPSVLVLESLSWQLQALSVLQRYAMLDISAPMRESSFQPYLFRASGSQNSPVQTGECPQRCLQPQSHESGFGTAASRLC